MSSAPRCPQPVPASPPSRAGARVLPSPSPSPRPAGGVAAQSLGRGHCCPHALFSALRRRSRRRSWAAPGRKRVQTTHPPPDWDSGRQREPEVVRGRGGSARQPAGSRRAHPAAPSRVAATGLGDLLLSRGSTRPSGPGLGRRKKTSAGVDAQWSRERAESLMSRFS